MVASRLLTRDVAGKSAEPARGAKSVGSMIVAAVLFCLGGCTNGAMSTKASSAAPAPGTVAVHMNGDAGFFAGAASP